PAPTKETVITRVGKNAVRYTESGGDAGIFCRALFLDQPLPLGTFLGGTYDGWLVSRTAGSPGIVVTLYQNAAKTDYINLPFPLPSTTTGSWQRVPWVARAQAGKRIYGIDIYVMGSWAAGGMAFSGTWIC